MTESFIYVIGHPDGPKKVGISGSPADRFRSLQTASPTKLSGEFFGACDRPVARAIESRAHDLLASARRAGEWFEVSLEDAVSAVMRAAADLGYEVRPVPPGEVLPVLVGGTDAVSGEQIQAARALLRWSQQELSERADVPVPTLKRVEGMRGTVRGTYETVTKIVGALRAAGIVFTNGGEPGVKLKARPAEGPTS